MGSHFYIYYEGIIVPSKNAKKPNFFPKQGYRNRPKLTFISEGDSMQITIPEENYKEKVLGRAEKWTDFFIN